MHQIQLEPIWHIAVWRAYLLLTLKHSACITFASPTALKGSFLAQTMSIKSFFLPAVFPAAYSFTRVFIQRSPRGSSSLYNALRKEGIIMNRRNSDVRREKFLCELLRIIEMSEHEFSGLHKHYPVSPVITFISSFLGISSSLPWKSNTSVKGAMK